MMYRHLQLLIFVSIQYDIPYVTCNASLVLKLHQPYCMIILEQNKKLYSDRGKKCQILHYIN